MAFKRLGLFRKNRRRDLREDPERYRDGDKFPAVLRRTTIVCMWIIKPLFAIHDLMRRVLLVLGEISRVAQIFLLIIPKRNRKHIIGDLEEEYRTTNKRFPRLWYWGQVFTLVASYWWASLRRRLGFDVVLKMIRK